MKLSMLGAIQIAVTPHADDPQIMSVDIGAENRKDPVSMTTSKDETVDQFVGRVRSMLRSLWNMESRTEEAKKEKEAETAKPKTWEQDKKTLMAGKP